ncbi:glycosyltransferase [Rhodobacter ferrooxidans]|nr:glycosyltransferase [Rhodobacter sp. SW2]
MKIQALGLCRFSYPAEGGFQVIHGNTAARSAALFHPDRLAQRFMWFEHVCLPGWAGQTDPDFTLLVLTGSDLPQPWLDRLRALTARVPQMQIVQEAPAPHRTICREVMQRNADPEADLIAEFRHDDDDAVAFDFIARLRADTGLLRGFLRSHRMLSLDYARGFVLSADAGTLSLHPRIETRLTAALAIVKRPRLPRSVLDFPHQRLTALMPGLTLQDSLMYVRGKHGSNDSSISLTSGHTLEMEPAAAAQALRQRFGIDLAGFQAVLAAMPASAS